MKTFEPYFCNNENILHTFDLTSGGICELVFLLSCPSEEMSLKIGHLRVGFLDDDMILVPIDQKAQPVLNLDDAESFFSLKFDVIAIPDAIINRADAQCFMTSVLFCVPPEATQVCVGLGNENAVQFHNKSIQIIAHNPYPSIHNHAKSWTNYLDAQKSLLIHVLSNFDLLDEAMVKECFDKRVEEGQFFIKEVFYNLAGRGDWRSVISSQSVADFLSEFRDVNLRKERKLKRCFGFLGSDALYHKLKTHFDLIFLSSDRLIEFRDELNIDAIIIEPISSSHRRRWSEDLRGTSGDSTSKNATNLFNFAQEEGIPIIVYWSLGPQYQGDFGFILNNATHIFAEGDKEVLEDFKWPVQPIYVPINFERTLARPVPHREDGSKTLIQFPQASELYEDPFLASYLRSIQGKNLLITDFVHDFSLQDIKEREFVSVAAIRRCSGYAERLQWLRETDIVVLSDSSLRAICMRTQIVIDAIASGAVVIIIGRRTITEYSDDIADLCYWVSSPPELLQLVRKLSFPIFREKIWSDAYRIISQNRVFDYTVQAIEKHVFGAENNYEGIKCSLISVVTEPHKIENTIRIFRKQEYDNKELIIVINTSSDLNIELPEIEENIKIVRNGQHANLGWCLNRAISLATGDIWLKIDGGDHYGSHYLENMANVFSHSAADIVGVPSGIEYFESDGLMICNHKAFENRRYEVCENISIVGATISGVVGKDLPQFPEESEHRCDVLWLEESDSSGKRIYYSSYLDYIAVKSDPKHYVASSVSTTGNMNCISVLGWKDRYKILAQND